MRPHTEELTSRKSSYRVTGNDCVEVARFRKSSYSTGRGQDCVEVADLPGGAAIRDTQNRSLGHLDAPTPEWKAFVAAVRS